MNIKFIILVATLCAGLASSSNIFADCTAKDMRDMKASGMSSSSIFRICSTSDEEGEGDQSDDSRSSRLRARSHAISPTQSLTNICQTQVMWCALFQQGPAGTPCWCNTAYGPVNGVLVPR